MRISDNMRFFSAKFNIQRSTQSLYSANDKVMTGKNFSKPSDAPSEINELLRLNTVNVTMNQHILNIDRADNRLREYDTILDRVASLLDKARDFGKTETNDVTDPAAAPVPYKSEDWIYTDTREIAAIEVSYVVDEMYDLANSKIDGKYIFAGFSTNIQPYSQATVPVSDGTTISLATDTILPLIEDPLVPGNAYIYEYFGDNGQVKVNTNEALTIQTNLTGTAVFGPSLTAAAPLTDPAIAPALPAVNVFYELDRLKQALEFNYDPLTPPDPDAYATHALYVAAVDTFENSAAYQNLETIRQSVMDTIRDATAKLEAGIDQVEKAQIDVGTRLENIASKKSSIETFQLGVINRISEIEDVDMPTAVMELRMMQTAYEVSINASARFMQVSLMDFLR